MPLAPADAPLVAPAPPYVVTRFDGHTCPSPDTEWLLTVGNGGYAMGCASLLPRRKYHALLIASTRPPVDRLSVLAALDETIAVDVGPLTGTWQLFSLRRDSGEVAPMGFQWLESFEKGIDRCVWRYRAGPVELEKELRLGWRRNVCAVRYRVRCGADAARLTISPRITLRDFHATQPRLDAGRYLVHVDEPARRIAVSAEAFDERRTAVIVTTAGRLEGAPGVTEGIRLDFESERGQEDVDSTFTPRMIVVDLTRGEMEFVVSAALEPEQPDAGLFAGSARAQRRAAARRAFIGARPERERLAPLVDAAEDFLATRPASGRTLTTVLAGFPWFADWGRDTMISMVGLMIVARRFEEARDALEAFARHIDRGMIPNLFADYGGAPEYNTVDASLWFLHACREYLRASGDRAGFDAALLPGCLEILEHYRRGTRYGIHMDERDALIAAGDETTQLTWMDARRNGVVFTPRHGKAIEINSLWYHGLLSMAEALDPTDAGRAGELRALAQRAGESIRRLFWNERERCLYDCLRPEGDGWTPIGEIRPNQIFAASLPHSALTREMARGVVERVKRDLLTPFGLRTLAPGDPKYQPRFEGDMMSRDRAYHNGTVWPWLIGAYVEALLRADDFSLASRQEGRGALRPLLESMRGGCLGQIAEIYEAEERDGRPRREQACIAQAWSVAEVLRAALLVEEGVPGVPGVPGASGAPGASRKR